jgi:hypothetical protein
MSTNSDVYATRGSMLPRSTLSAMDALLLIGLLVLLAIAAPRWGADSHRSGEWGPGQPRDTWRRPDRLLPRMPHGPFNPRV